MSDNQFSADDIEVLQGLEPIRRRPSLYLGGELTDPLTINKLIKEAICHALDEKCSKLHIHIQSNEVSIEYDAGMPLKMRDGICGAEVIMTKLHACKNFKKDQEIGKQYCSIGMAIVNALSEVLSLKTASRGKIGKQHYQRGEPTAPFQIENWEGSDFTKITFTPDRELFNNISFDSSELFDWFRQVKRDFPNLEIVFDGEKLDN